jgi:hypothetical protein
LSNNIFQCRRHGADKKIRTAARSGRNRNGDLAFGIPAKASAYKLC